MRREFPNYKGADVFKIKLKPIDRKILNSFLTDIRGSAGEKRTHNIERTMIQICDTSRTPLNKWDYSVLSKFLELLNKSDKANHTKNDYKKTLKRFLKFYYSDWNKRFRGLDNGGIKQKKAVNKKKISKEKLFSPEDFQKLISGCDRFFFKALFSLAWDTSARPSEIYNLRWEDIDLDNNKVKLTRYKTNNVSWIPLDPEGSVIHLINHKNNFIYPDVKQKDYVFVSPENRDKPITNQTIHSHLNTIGKKTLNRTDLYMYLFRHTRLNYLRRILSPDMYEAYADHSLEVGMEMYSHNDDEDLEQEMFDKVFKTSVLTKTEKEEIIKLRRNFAETIRLIMETIKNPSEDKLRKLNKKTKEIELIN
jgi:integrase